MKEFFGIDVGGTAVKWAVLGEDYSIRERGSLPTSFSAAEEVVEALAGLVEPYRERVSAVGVSAPGGIYEGDEDGTIHRGGALTYMDGCPLGRLLRERLGMPVSVNNDGKCCALGEYAAGALRGHRIGVVLAIGTGIGGGIVIDGHVLRGSHGFAGEFSFLRNDVTRAAAMDNVFAGTGGWRALRDAAVAEKGLPADTAVDGRRVFEWIEAGDEAAQRALDRYARTFDAQLVNLQAVLDPEVFVIAGGISCHPELIDALRAQMPAALAGYEGGFAGIPEPQIKVAELGNDANLYGAVQEAMCL